MSTLEVVAAIVGGAVTIITGMVALIRWVLSQVFEMHAGHLTKVETTLAETGREMTTSLTGIRLELSGLKNEVTLVKIASERTAKRLDEMADQVDQLTPPPMDTRRIRKASNGG